MYNMMRPFHLSLLAIVISAGPVLSQEEPLSEPTQRTDAPFRLFPTKNIYTFLKLDTRTGQIWQLQWNTEPAKRLVEAVNLKPLADGKKTGRFTLYPSFNIFNFILLDQEDGRQWEVQWNTDPEKRFVEAIVAPQSDR